jgi:hypothetical protein
LGSACTLQIIDPSKADADNHTLSIYDQTARFRLPNMNGDIEQRLATPDAGMPRFLYFGCNDEDMLFYERLVRL